MSDELDARIRSLEAERMRPMPPAPPPSPRPPDPVTVETDEHADSHQRELVDALDDTHEETRREKALRVRNETGSLRGVMDALGVSYREARRLTENELAARTREEQNQ